MCVINCNSSLTYNSVDMDKQFGFSNHGTAFWCPCIHLVFQIGNIFIITYYNIYLTHLIEMLTVTYLEIE